MTLRLGNPRPCTCTDGLDVPYLQPKDSLVSDTSPVWLSSELKRGLTCLVPHVSLYLQCCNRTGPICDGLFDSALTICSGR